MHTFSVSVPHSCSCCAGSTTQILRGKRIGRTKKSASSLPRTTDAEIDGSMLHAVWTAGTSTLYSCVTASHMLPALVDFSTTFVFDIFHFRAHANNRSHEEIRQRWIMLHSKTQLILSMLQDEHYVFLDERLGSMHAIDRSQPSPSEPGSSGESVHHHSSSDHASQSSSCKHTSRDLLKPWSKEEDGEDRSYTPIVTALLSSNCGFIISSQHANLCAGNSCTRL
jgi:hypothetical protein